MQTVIIQPDFDSWRAAARALVAGHVPATEILWSDGDAAIALLPRFASEPTPATANAGAAAPVTPRAFLTLAQHVACHREPGRWDLLYRILFRLTHGERELLDVVVDDDVHRALMMERAVTRDRHKMTAFVRFRRIDDATDEGGPTDGHYVAWHRPDHYIVRLTTPFFVRRFPNMHWTILTPDASVSWDGPGATEPCFGLGVPASKAPEPDDLEDLWRTYYANIFNPARINLRAMRKELPVRHWPTLPETQIIPDLLRDAPRRVEAMMRATSKNAKRSSKSKPGEDVHRTSAKGEANPPAVAGSGKACESTGCASDFLPATRSLPQLREASKSCRGCDIYCNATQTVFGEGPADATVMFVGEQPGDQEDKAGHPFIGPAGKLLDGALAEAGIARDACYVTNAVKHFKWEPRGTRRLHAKPSAREVSACKPWLEAEIAAIKPRMIVCLGATAAQALLGRDFRVTQHRGEVIESDYAPRVLATVHPSSLLRIPDPALREQSCAQFIDDLKVVARQIEAVRR